MPGVARRRPNARDRRSAASPSAIYNPDETGPTLIFVHGGGWVIGGIRSHDHIARWLATEISGRVVQIEYALAPEHPFPAALDQVSAVVGRLLAESAGPCMLAGDSAGANLAAMSHIARCRVEQRGPLAGFVSIYGAYAPGDEPVLASPLRRRPLRPVRGADAMVLEPLRAATAPRGAGAGNSVPLTADLAGFPPTLCIGAECDLLLDDTLAFYGELVQGARSTFRCRCGRACRMAACISSASSPA